MSSALTPLIVETAFRNACLGELRALKPGNVHIFAGGHKLSVADFERSAAAAAGPISRAGISVGERILAATQATCAAVGTNTNLGIILLAAPLVDAAMQVSDAPFYDRVKTVLARLTVEDARKAYAAIRLAEPGGMGKADDQDVNAEPDVSLLEAMRAAQRRDKVAYQYAHDYHDVLALGLERYRWGLSQWGDERGATSYVFMGFLAAFRDTLISRKFGEDVADEVQTRASRLDAAFRSSWPSEKFIGELLKFDAELKTERLNPGTSADLTVATILWHELDSALCVTEE